MSEGYTTSVLWSYDNEGTFNSSYEDLENTWQAYPFEAEENAGWAPYLAFGDISSLTNPGSDVYNPYFDLWTKSCWDGDIQNCTSVCTDPTKLFVNSTAQGDDPKMSTNVTYNVLACMYYPILSKFLAGPAQPNNDSWNQLVAMGEQYNIVPNASVGLISQVVHTQVDCYYDYCWTVTDNFCKNFNISYDNNGNSITYYQAMTGPGLLPVFPDWSTISPIETMNINTDLGGVGVSIAYMIEFTILGLTWVLLRYLRLGRIMKKRSLTLKSGHSDAELQSSNGFRPLPYERHADWSREHKMQHETNKFLAEFHQTQCWFFIAINLVVLLGLTGNTTIFGTASLGQLDRNMAYAQCILQGGIVFVTASMWLMLFEDYFYDDAFNTGTGTIDRITEQPIRPLTSKSNHSVEGIEDTKKSIALWLLTLISVAIGTTAWALSFQLDHPEDRIKPALGNSYLSWPATCGLISPATYNSETWDSEWTHKNHISDRLPILIFCWLLITVMFISFFKRHYIRMWKNSHPHGKVLTWVTPLATHIWTKRVLVTLIELLMLTCLGFLLRDYVILMRPSLPQIDKTFSMGQMLAIFAWAPAIIGVYYRVWDWFAGATVETWKASRANTMNVIAEPKGSSHGSSIQLTDSKHMGAQMNEVH